MKKGAEIPLNPIALAIASDASFVGRSFAGDIEHLSGLIRLGIEHKGFALIDVLQPCVVFNHKNTYAWYRERVYKLEENGYDPGNKMAAFEKAQEWGDRIPIGVIYRKERATFEERLPALTRGPLARRRLDPMQAEKLLDEFM